MCSGIFPCVEAQSEKPMMCASRTWYAWYVVSADSPAPRNAASRASMYAIRAGRIRAGDISMVAAHGCRFSAAWADSAEARIAGRPPSGAGGSISASTRSRIPSSRSSLFATWL